VGAGGQKSVSVGLIDKFNPQNIITTPEQYANNQGQFIFITLLAIAITLYTAYIFFSIALLFVARVISLWISMIFSPVAFVSYTVPFDIPGFGHKEWWSELLKNAFLAPVFIFFLYIIILFASFLKTISLYTSSTDMIQHIMATIIPFILMYILLKKAKELAVTYSGEMGKGVISAGSAIGGFALGAATGGVAALGTSTVGNIAHRVADNNNLRKKAMDGDKGAQRILNRANSVAKRSFDFRQTGAGKFLGKETGMDFDKGLGFAGLDTKAFKGGRHEQQEHKIEKARSVMKTYEMSDAEAVKQDSLSKAAKDQNERAKGYEEDKKKAKEYMGSGFVESEFKRDYEKGGNLKNGGWGLDKEVEAGSVEHVKEVKTSKEINDKRKAEYINHLEDPEREKGVAAVRTFFAEWKNGMKKMTTTAGGLGATAVGATVAGPMGAGVTIVGGGFLQALKETIKPKPTPHEIVTALRKGEDPLKQALKEISKLTNKDEHGKNEESHGGKPAPHAPTPAPSSSHEEHAPAPSSSHEEHGGGHH
jgi:hypothetical protein